MGRRLPDEVVYRIRVRIEAGEGVPAIAKAIRVARRTLYKIRVNLDLYGQRHELLLRTAAALPSGLRGGHGECGAGGEVGSGSWVTVEVERRTEDQ